MVITQARSRRTATGSRYVAGRAKRQFEAGREPTLPRIGVARKKTLRTLGGDEKVITLRTESINIQDPKAKKSVKAKILSVKENPANPNYVRRNIITKGCTLSTDKGDVKVTSRPGQEGTINGVLL